MRKKQVEIEDLDGLILTIAQLDSDRERSKQQLAEARQQVQEKFSAEDRLSARMLQFKLSINVYLQSQTFHPEMSFGACVAKYIQLLGKKRRDFASEIKISESELSQIINQHRRPAEYILIRLEIHSNGNVPAHWWYGLVEKEYAHFLATSRKLRQYERKHVSRKLRIKV